MFTGKPVNSSLTLPICDGIIKSKKDGPEGKEIKIENKPDGLFSINSFVPERHKTVGVAGGKRICVFPPRPKPKRSGMEVTMTNAVLFFNSFLSYLLLFAVIVALVVTAALIGISMRKKKDRKNAAAAAEAESRQE